MSLDKNQLPRNVLDDDGNKDNDGLYEYENDDICIISPVPITPEMIDAAMKDAGKSFIERIRENPNSITEYCGETPLEDYLSGKPKERRTDEEGRLLS